jgi:transposase
MNKEKVVFVGLDASKATLAVSVAEDGRDGEVRDWGTISMAPTSVEKFLKKLAARFDRVEICYEAGPTGYGLYRQITAFGFTCYVVAPSLIPVRPASATLEGIEVAHMIRKQQFEMSGQSTFQQFEALAG